MLRSSLRLEVVMSLWGHHRRKRISLRGSFGMGKAVKLTLNWFRDRHDIESWVTGNWVCWELRKLNVNQWWNEVGFFFWVWPRRWHICGTVWHYSSERTLWRGIPAPLGPAVPEGFCEASGTWTGTLDPNMTIQRSPVAWPGQQGHWAPHAWGVRVL